MQIKKGLRPDARSLGLMALFGLLAGVATRLTDFLPASSMWAVQSIATLFGFWMVTVTLVIYRSATPAGAAVCVFAYLSCMNIGFYGLKYLYRFFAPGRADEGFQTSLFLLYTGLALACSIAGFVLHHWNRGGRLGSVLYGLPVGGLAAETIALALYFAHHRTFLFQLIFDLIGFAAFGLLFFRKADSKPLYILAVAAAGLAGYLLVYAPFLSI